jgi:hypothetical protein
MVPVLLLAAFAQDQFPPLPAVQGQTPAPSMVAPQANMTVPPVYPELNRLALSPKLDGKIDSEEWDPLLTANGVESYFQWEPHRAHVAAKLRVGQDLLVSLDLRGDGWFAGADNVEIRAKWTGTNLDYTVRRMNASGQMGPSWMDATDLRATMQLVATGDSSTWTAELTLEDPGLGFLPEDPGQRIGVRVDAININDVPMDAFAPRLVPSVNTVFDRGTGLPQGLRWKTEYRGRSVIPSENMRIRAAFDGTDGLAMKRVEMRTEGLGRDYTVSQGVPFPDFDRKFRAFVDYNTKIADQAPIGWRLLRVTVFDKNDQPTVLQSSYEIAAPVNFDWEAKTIASSEEPQNIRLACFIRSNTRRRVDGQFRVIPPAGWEIKSGNEKSFTLAIARARKRQVFEVQVPGGFKGTVPLKLVAVIGPYTAERTVWLIVQ